MLGFRRAPKKKAAPKDEHTAKCQNVGGNCNGVCVCADHHVKESMDALDSVIRQKKALVERVQGVRRKTDAEIIPFKR